MEASVMELTQILEQEYHLYEEIASLEDAKSETIMNRDGKLLEKTSIAQEKLVADIARLEEKRGRLVKAYCQKHSFQKSADQVTLRELAADMEQVDAEHLLHYGTKLKKTIHTIKSLQQTNDMLIKDNIEFFDILLSGLKNTAAMQAGYSQKGETREVKSNPVLFNQTV